MCPPVAYLRAEKNLILPNYEFGKGQYAFYTMISSHFEEKNKVHQKYQNFIRRTLTNWVKCLSTNKNIQKSNIIFEGSRHPKFMNPFKYGESLIG